MTGKDYQSNVESPATNEDKIQKAENVGEVYVGSHVEYATYVEFGTSRMSAQPYLRPALDIARGKALILVEQDGKTIFAEYLNDE